ncbi:sulfate permease [Microbacterium sp. YY-01]|uniref:sulfate permease n=1 Tax=Microbacterium sp. YY-01 TaxID=3421634 RepID=UPI003D17225E
MLRIIWMASLYARAYMRRFMPTNIPLDEFRTRRGWKWGVPAMLLAAVYFDLATPTTMLREHGASKLLYLMMIVCVWNAFKFLIYGPVSLVLLARARGNERRICRRVSVASFG